MGYQEAWTQEVQAKLGDFMKGGAAEAPPPAAPAAVDAAPAVAPAAAAEQQASGAGDEEALAAVLKNLHSAIRWCVCRRDRCRRSSVDTTV